MSKKPTIHFLFSTRFWIPLAFVLLLGIGGCDTPEKVLKSDNTEYKKNRAIYWYNKKEYFKCIPVFEELIGQLKARESVEDIYYMYCNANYKQGDYMISAYHYKNFYDQYPNNEHAEECLFMQGKSYQMLSPKPDLDQTYTYKALEAYQFFLNIYSDTKYLYEANQAMVILRKKLEKKALNAADLYYKTSNFKAAAASYENILVDFPDIEESEKVSFMVIKSRFKYAQLSIASKKAERFKSVIKSYKDFKYKFSSSKFLDEAKSYEQQSHYLAAMGAFEWAELAPLEERETYFKIAFQEAKEQMPFFTDKKETETIQKQIEKGHFLVIKGYYLLSEQKKLSEKMAVLDKTVKSYYNFVDQFPKSRHMREAERIFKSTTDLIEKLKKESENG